MCGKLDLVRLNIDKIGKIDVKKGSKFKEIAKKIYPNNYKDFLGVKINNEIKHLDYKIEENCDIEFLDITDKDGMRIYVRTLSYIYIKACNELYSHGKVTIEHSLSKGLYSEIHKEKDLVPEDIEIIKNKMRELIEQDLDITREKVDKEQARKIFEVQEMDDKLELLKYRKKDYIHMYNLENYYDIFYGYLAPSTGYIKKFDLKYYSPGVIIQFPRKENDFSIPEFQKQKKLFTIFRETEKWGEILEIGCVGVLNNKIVDGSIEEIIRVSEALHEKKIAYIADKIEENGDIRVISIAGPSSSGKTTFAQRLAIQLKVNGRKSSAISLDDYFVDREKTPLNENGEYDFEAIEAIDLEKFNDDLIKIMNGECVELPTYNFITGKREYNGHKMQIGEKELIIIEGIHGLNEKLTSSIPHNNKFKIYISALTQLNIDAHNRIPTTDARLIRRIVRDNTYRGNSAEKTLEMWNAVREGEEKNIFPFQEEADIMFNSALAYEIALLKKHIEPLLREIDITSKYYPESKRLLKFISYFESIEDESSIPNTSIIKEFIGGSCFRKN